MSYTIEMRDVNVYALKEKYYVNYKKSDRKNRLNLQW